MEKNRINLVVEDLYKGEISTSKRYKMLFFGLFSISLYFFNLFNYKNNFYFLQMFVGHDIAGLIVYFFGIFLGLWFLLWRGILFVGYSKFEQIDDMFSKRHMFGYNPTAKPVSPQFNNINNIIDYANNKCFTASREEASMILGKLSSIYAIPNTSEGLRVLEYMDCKLTTMSREEGLNFIASRNK